MKIRINLITIINANSTKKDPTLSQRRAPIIMKNTNDCAIEWQQSYIVYYFKFNKTTILFDFKTSINISLYIDFYISNNSK